MRVKPRGRKTVPAGKLCLVTGLWMRGSIAAVAPRNCRNSATMWYEYISIRPPRTPFFSTHCRNDQRRHLGRIL